MPVGLPGRLVGWCGAARGTTRETTRAVPTATTTIPTAPHHPHLPPRLPDRLMPGAALAALLGGHRCRRTGLAAAPGRARCDGEAVPDVEAPAPKASGHDPAAHDALPPNNGRPLPPAVARRAAPARPVWPA